MIMNIHPPYQCGEVIVVGVWAERCISHHSEMEHGPEPHVQNQHKEDFISTSKMSHIWQQRPESPTVTLTWHASKYKVHGKKLGVLRPVSQYGYVRANKVQKVHQKYTQKVEKHTTLNTWKRAVMSRMTRHLLQQSVHVQYINVHVQYNNDATLPQILVDQWMLCLYYRNVMHLSLYIIALQLDTH